MSKRRKMVIEIFAPVEGLHTELPASMITPRSTPDVDDCNAYYGIIQKDYGTSLITTETMGGAVPVNYYYDAIYPDLTKLQGFNHTGMYQYVDSATGWTADGQVYSGTFTDFWNGCMHNGELFYTNGVDLIQRKSAYNSTGDVMGGVATASYKAFAIASFKEHLNLYHTVESGTESYKRVRWSKVGTLGYTGTDWTAGTAGFQDISDAEGEILTAEQLGGGFMVIYCEGSIHIQEWIGGASVYRITKMVSGLDIPTRRCVAVNDSVHYVLTRTDIYEYRGGTDFRSIGDPVKNIFMTLINKAAMGYAWIQFVKDVNELRVHVPTGNNTQPDTVYICKVSEGYRWFKSTREHTAHGRTTLESGITIGDLVDPIGSYANNIGDWEASAGAPIYVIGDTSGYTMRMARDSYNIVVDGTTTAQSWFFETKDFSPNQNKDPEDTSQRPLEYGEHEVRWLNVQAEFKGYGAVVTEFSTNGGATWSTADEGAKTISTTWDMYTWDIDRSSEMLRARFSNAATSELPQLRFVKVSFIGGSEIPEEA